ncbi:MAG TPA: FtsK/SpoIIIE domain-containing protein [Lactobacillaceae bacterium]|jgi:hypothetical protein
MEKTIYRDYVTNLLKQASGRGDFRPQGEELRARDYEEDIRIFPEPLDILSTFDGMDDPDARINLLHALINQAPVIKAPQPAENLWFNESTNGLNLRPGMHRDEADEVLAIPLGDNMAHALVAGRTGSGKSVFLNNLLMSLMSEYAPWEVDIYLADFKKVELSRYLSDKDNQAPHVKAVAATSQMPYVMSLLRYLAKVMDAREQFFARISEKNIADFRKRYDVVLPRVLLVVDEFQQMFLQANEAEHVEIQHILTEIAKKGRSSGVHLLFASQEMSDTLPASTLLNFKARFALPADPAVSEAIINTPAAAQLAPHHVMFNQSSGDDSTVQAFLVPYLDSDVPDVVADVRTIAQTANKLDNFLALFNVYANEAGFNKAKTFFQEDFAHDLSLVRDLRQTGELQQQVDAILNTHPEYNDYLVVGEPTTYMPAALPLAYQFLKNGRLSNIGAVSDDLPTLGYILNVLTMNFTATDRYRHLVLNLSTSIRPYFDLVKQLEATSSHVKVYEHESDLLEELQGILNDRYAWVQFLIDKLPATLAGVGAAFDNARLAEIGRNVTDVLSGQPASHATDEAVLTLLVQMGLDDYLAKSVFKALRAKFMETSQDAEKFERLVWLVGTENLEADFLIQHEALFQQLPTRNARVIFVQNGFDSPLEWSDSIRYLWLKSADVEQYHRFGLQTTAVGQANYVDFWTKDTKQQQTVKMFRVPNANKPTPVKLNFDFALD